MPVTQYTKFLYPATDKIQYLLHELYEYPTW